MKSMLVINFKAYSQATGKEALEVAEKCASAAEEFKSELILAPQSHDLLRLDDTEATIYSQHLSSFSPGSHTGHPVAEGLEDAGAEGTLLNHSERRIPDRDMLKTSIDRARKNEMEVILCAQSPEEVGELSKLKPDYIAFEPPELIGGDTAVSEAEPELIEKAYRQSEVPLLAGAGINDSDDVEKAVELGCEGVLVASGVIKSENIEESVKELMSGL